MMKLIWAGTTLVVLGIVSLGVEQLSCATGQTLRIPPALGWLALGSGATLLLASVLRREDR